MGEKASGIGQLIVGAILTSIGLSAIGIPLIISGAGLLTAQSLDTDQDAYIDPGFKLRQNTRSTEEPIRVVYGEIQVGGNDVFIEASGTNNQQLWIVQTLSEGPCYGVATDGTEKVTNGGFDTDSDWSKGTGWTITGGKAVKTAGTESAISQSVTDVSTNGIWQIQFTISDYSAGTVYLKLGTTQGLRTYSANGTYTEIIESASGSTLEIYGDASFAGKIDDVSVQLPLIYLNDQLHSEYDDKVSLWFHHGSNDQAVNPSLNSAIAKWTDTMPNVCYIVWKLTFDRDYYTMVPRRTVVLKGREVYDYRTATTGYSDNIALIAYDLMANSLYGMDLESSFFDTNSWTSAANYCDTKSWGFNGVVDGRKAIWDELQTILRLFRGTFVWYDYKFYLYYADLNYESSAMTLTDAHIVQDANGRALLNIKQPSRLRRPDAVKVTYIDPDKSYISDHVMIGDANGNVKQIRLLGCTNRQHASDIAVYDLERSQLNRIISGTFRDNALKLDPHNVVTFSSDAFSISNQKMRVMQTRSRNDGLIDLTLLYEATALYNDNYDLNAENTYTCTIPSPDDAPPAPANVVISEETYNFRLRTFTRLKVSFDDPPNYPWLDYVEVWVSFDDVTYEHLFNASDDFIIDPVEEDTTYYLKLYSVSIWSRRTTEANVYKASKTVTGLGDAPASLAALQAVVNQNSVNLYATKLTDPDIEVYEFRMGSSWSGAVFLAALRSPNLSLFGVKPGNFTFWCNTKSNNGQYGATPRSASVSLVEPPDGWTVDGSITQTDTYQ